MSAIFSPIFLFCFARSLAMCECQCVRTNVFVYLYMPMRIRIRRLRCSIFPPSHTHTRKLLFCLSQHLALIERRVDMSSFESWQH